MAKYEVMITDPVYRQLSDIEQYLTNVLFARSAAKRRIQQILTQIHQLEQYPGRGFNADVKLGHAYFKGSTTFGLPIVSGKYILLYTIDPKQNIVIVLELVSTQSDYTELFI